MNSAGFLLLNFLTVPLLLAQNATTAQPDGMRILQMMSERYAGAKSWYIAATEERTSWNDYSRSWTKTLMIGVVSGNRYHFEAIRLPDESLMLNGRVIPCYAVRVRSEQRKGPYTAGYTSEEKLWIEKANWSVRKRVVHEFLHDRDGHRARSLQGHCGHDLLHGRAHWSGAGVALSL
jgi:hypothetical protein